TQQIAGDLLPNATQEQILATTFCRLHPQKVEGGSVPEEFRVEYVADRNQTFATAFLGLTMECARCHEHKYDPITQKNYYELSAFFANIDEAGLYSYFTDAIPTPSLLLTDADTEAKQQIAREAVATAQQRVNQVAAARCAEFQRWLDNEALDDAGESLVDRIPNRLTTLTFEDFKDGANVKVPGKVGSAVKLTGDDVVNLDIGNFRRSEPFSVSLWMNTPDHKERAVIFHRSRAWTDAASRGYELLLEDGKLSAALIHFWPGNALRVVAREPLPIGAWSHVVMTYDGSSQAAGLRLYVNGQPIEVDIVRDHLFKNITGGGGDHLAIGERFRDHGFTQGLVDEFAVFNRELTPLECLQLAGGDSLLKAIRTAQQEVARAATTHDQASDILRSVYSYYLSAVDAEYRAAL
ncbi:MAG: DUF1549 domain-containing protein, partial [Planctomycetales bacterium]|nr:DUF1549 domain-containing protein [Planctomycetales bacterium]